jgi:hypothetical protein
MGNNQAAVIADLLTLLDVTLRQKTLMPKERDALARLKHLAEQNSAERRTGIVEAK